MQETWINHCVIAHSSPHSGGALFIFPIEKTYFNGKSYNFKTLDGLDTILLFVRERRGRLLYVGFVILVYHLLSQLFSYSILCLSWTKCLAFFKSNDLHLALHCPQSTCIIFLWSHIHSYVFSGSNILSSV